jgi:hypothetical protein
VAAKAAVQEAEQAVAQLFLVVKETFQSRPPRKVLLAAQERTLHLTLLVAVAQVLRGALFLALGLAALAALGLVQASQALQQLTRAAAGEPETLLPVQAGLAAAVKAVGAGRRQLLVLRTLAAEVAAGEMGLGLKLVVQG